MSVVVLIFNMNFERIFFVGKSFLIYMPDNCLSVPFVFVYAQLSSKSAKSADCEVRKATKKPKKKFVKIVKYPEICDTLKERSRAEFTFER